MRFLLVISLISLSWDLSESNSLSGRNFFNDFISQWNNIQQHPDLTDESESGAKETTCACGTQNKRIVGGTTTQPNEYPFVLSMIDTLTREHFCGASILTESFAITAAHCTHGRGRPITILAGAHNIKRINSQVQESQVVRVIEHERYQQTSGGLYNDVAILVLRTPLRFNTNVVPICVPASSSLNLENEMAKNIGWGKLGINIGTSPTLQEIDVRIHTDRECKEYFPFSYDPSVMICSGNPGVTACMGDSGGPLIWLDPEINRYTLVGLVSFGIPGCKPGVPIALAEVSSFLDWIKSKINKPLCHKV